MWEKYKEMGEYIWNQNNVDTMTQKYWEEMEKKVHKANIRQRKAGM